MLVEGTPRRTPMWFTVVENYADCPVRTSFFHSCKDLTIKHHSRMGNRTGLDCPRLRSCTTDVGEWGSLFPGQLQICFVFCLLGGDDLFRDASIGEDSDCGRTILIYQFVFPLSLLRHSATLCGHSAGHRPLGLVLYARHSRTCAFFFLLITRPCLPYFFQDRPLRTHRTPRIHHVFDAFSSPETRARR